ncbi:MAG: ATP-binding cassette domain-containing protein [Methanomicrobiales archaeon]|nr:ATP-binding cassette domain-containing protein [Methanomicrobiales archaeon]
MSLLSVHDLSKDFGGLHAVSHLSFSVEGGEILGLIGPNGAGKTTVFNLITGFTSPTAGEIGLNGTRLVGLKPHAITQRGVARTFHSRWPSRSAWRSPARWRRAPTCSSWTSPWAG